MKELGYSTDPEVKRLPHPLFNEHVYRHLPKPLKTPVMRALQALYFQGGAGGYRKLFARASAMREVERKFGASITADYELFGLYSRQTTEAFPFSAGTDHAKFITILRNPVDFLFSFYTKETGQQYRETHPDVTFDHFVRHTRDFYTAQEAFVRIEQQLLEPWRPVFAERSFFDESQYFLATFMVCYVVFVKEWASRLPKERFLVVSFQDFSERVGETMNTIFDFLEVPRFEVPDTTPRNANEYDSKIPDKTASYLREFCRPYNEELYEFLGRDLGWD